MTVRTTEFIIPRENAVFWLDGNGRWHNDHGPFENRKIITFFHSHIRRDAAGYHVAQRRENLIEKVYFRYEDTALFVFDVSAKSPIMLVLNTGKQVRLMPRKLMISGDGLYMHRRGERIKFVDRALLKISRIIDFDDPCYFIRVGGRRYRIPESTPESSSDPGRKERETTISYLNDQRYPR
jgi:hypothetical protein